MAIYQPYFYVIQDVRNGMYYAGAKWARDANPSNFMVEGGYETSSETIKELIRQHGLNNFIVRKIRTFETGEEAHDYETRFLVRVDARNHPRFYNGHNNDGYMNVNKMKQIMLELYGVEYYSQTDEYREKYESTCMEKYGVRNVFGSPDIIEKGKKTRLEKYGNENYVNTEKIKETKKDRYGDENYTNREQARKTKLEKYGNENYVNTEKIKETKKDRYGDENYNNREQAKRTSVERFGTENAMGSKIVQDIRKERSLEKHGVDHYSKTDEYREKYTNTSMERYGVSNPSKSDEIKDKNLLSCMEKYGCESYTQTEKFKESARSTWLENYGVDNPSKSPIIKEKIGNKAKERDASKKSRPQVIKLKEYIELHGSKSVGCGPAWFRKSDEYLNELLQKAINEFGPI